MSNMFDGYYTHAFMYLSRNEYETEDEIIDIGLTSTEGRFFTLTKFFKYDLLQSDKVGK